MRAGPQLGVDAFSISNYGSAMFAQVQPQHSPLMMPVCMQPVATLTLQTFAKVFLGRRFILSTLTDFLFYHLISL